ncbi:MAG: PilZ domain-containing protein [Candidatus Lambdaproteobacteria bacterium]|nr:PilZ domain-containing protein [Candidatus Lambdaproteobacteria bacterium]
MEPHRYTWWFDARVLEYLRRPELTGFEIILILLGLTWLLLYLLGVRWLDLLARLWRKRKKRLAQLERWLDAAALSAGELELLDLLAEGGRPIDRYLLLCDPLRFETRVHEAYAGSEGDRFAFTARLRRVLQGETGNLRAPIVSTRQLRQGDALRLSCWEHGLPQHFYGRVAETGPRTFLVGLDPEGLAALLRAGAEAELFYLRGDGEEFRFACRPERVQPAPQLLALAHALVELDHLPRKTRLPVLMEVVFHVRASGGDAVSDLDPANAATKPEAGMLFDLSEGGAALLGTRQVEVGRYLAIVLPLKGGRAPLELVGRVLECRSFSGRHWLVRCAFRGLGREQHTYLQQLVRLEQRRRLRTFAAIHRLRRRAG